MRIEWNAPRIALLALLVALAALFCATRAHATRTTDCDVACSWPPCTTDPQPCSDMAKECSRCRGRIAKGEKKRKPPAPAPRTPTAADCNITDSCRCDDRRWNGSSVCDPNPHVAVRSMLDRFTSLFVSSARADEEVKFPDYTVTIKAVTDCSPWCSSSCVGRAIVPSEGFVAFFKWLARVRWTKAECDRDCTKCRGDGGASREVPTDTHVASLDADSLFEHKEGEPGTTIMPDGTVQTCVWRKMRFGMACVPINASPNPKFCNDFQNGNA